MNFGLLSIDLKVSYGLLLRFVNHNCAYKIIIIKVSILQNVRKSSEYCSNGAIGSEKNERRENE